MKHKLINNRENIDYVSQIVKNFFKKLSKKDKKYEGQVVKLQ